MNFIKNFFNYNSLKGKPRSTVQNHSGFIEKDAAPVDYVADCSKEKYGAVPNLCSTNSVMEQFAEQNNLETHMEPLSLSENFNEPIDRFREVTDNSPSAEHNTINVHNANQQVVMQISNVNSLHFGTVYNINNRSSSTSECTDMNELKNGKDKKKFNKKTTTIEVMMKSLDEPNHRMLDTIATHLGSGWRQVMRELGYSEGQISSLELDNHIHGTKEIIYQILLDWMSNEADESRNVGYLTKLLWNCGHRECVHRMKMAWKSELDSKKN